MHSQIWPKQGVEGKRMVLIFFLKKGKNIFNLMYNFSQKKTNYLEINKQKNFIGLLHHNTFLDISV